MVSHGRRDRLGTVTAPSTAAALARAAEAGPYFAIDAHPEPLLWRPFAALLDPVVLGENVDQVRRVLQERAGTAELDQRACASIHALGLVSRLVAPALGSAAVAGHVPRLAVEDLWWQRVAGGPVPVAVGAPAGVDVADPNAAARALHTEVIDTSVAPLVAAFESAFALSPQVLWGNVASAVAGAATMLERCSLTLRVDPRELAVQVTSRGALTGMGRWTSAGFTRNNCCLFYKIPGGGTCGDCVLA